MLDVTQTTKNSVTISDLLSMFMLLVRNVNIFLTAPVAYMARQAKKVIRTSICAFLHSDLKDALSTNESMRIVYDRHMDDVAPDQTLRMHRSTWSYTIAYDRRPFTA